MIDSGSGIDARSFKVNNVTFQIDIDSPLRTSQGEKPGPIVKIPGDSRF